jgi:hypothetical protein
MPVTMAVLDDMSSSSITSGDRKKSIFEMEWIQKISNRVENVTSLIVVRVLCLLL